LRLDNESLEERIRKYWDKEHREGEKLFVYYFGDIEAETCKSWCSDCRSTDSSIRETINKLPGAVLLEVQVGIKEDWKKETNIYRNHASAKVTNIPTLIKWTRSGPEERLVEAEIADQKRLDNFVGV